ncbi:hypothetical protein HMPREF3170_09250 [Corynebacterium sp. HMSC08D02]|nr:hypothetical protein HMPREF3170_09250 [Corynebacterium sp. HMSC08D02]
MAWGFVVFVLAPNSGFSVKTAKSLEQRLEELDARRDALKRQMRERDKRERQRFGKREQPETLQPSEQRKDG